MPSPASENIAEKTASIMVPERVEYMVFPNNVSCPREVSKCIVKATILAIDSDMGWYYWSCKDCSKKVVPVLLDGLDEDEAVDILPMAFHCTRCRLDNPILVLR
ncbi:PREDICTED: uncharacterized protein LOC104707183 [Camelina sativa]|uniref:Uncharacterized protein LOC104707183 n=1 Tax=Camelina sativa TaxID=90675 RepID=A0ABM1QB86_CAMSA|nr:PREDICTED: uncharacterized protein LOC104707183 [Camelina sativa]